LTWQAGDETGGTPVIDYTIAYDQGLGGDVSTFITLVSEVKVTSYTARGLTTGTTYRFMVLARNAYGQSVYCTPVPILAAQIPEAPISPQTEISGPNVVLSWTAPPTGGSPITGYIVTIKTSDATSTFLTELVHCDGASTAVRTSTTCTVPILSLRSQPFNLPWGSSIQIQVVAYNIYGNSVSSVIGNGAIILTVPDAPTSLAENTSLRGVRQLSVTWSQGYAGGTPVIDYTISWAENMGTIQILA